MIKIFVTLHSSLGLGLGIIRVNESLRNFCNRYHHLLMGKPVEEYEMAVEVDSLETPPTNTIDKFWYYVKQALKKLDAIGVETRGIDRVPPWERAVNRKKQLISVIGLWISACGGLSSMSSFYLGPLLFGLGLKNSMIPGLVGHTVGCFIAAYCSMMGPRLGCRQMVGARFLFGWWTVKFVSLFSVLGVMGWSIVNSVVGGQILASMSNEKVPLVAGIIIIMVVSLLVLVCGIKQVIKVEAFLAIPVNFAFLMLYVVLSKRYSYLSNDNAPGEDSATIKGNWISFFSLCYSITSTWGTIASDYYILFPENTPDSTVFSITLLGIWIPTTFVGVAGLLIGNCALKYQPWGEAYEKYGMGGLLWAAFEPWGGGGKFLLILIFLSLISNNIINTYSAAFGLQLGGRWMAKIPRWLWAILVFAVCLVCALVGRNEFLTILGNFLPMIGYWVSMYFILLFEENTIFRTDRFKPLYTKEFPHNAIEELLTLQEKQFVGTRDVRVNQHYNWLAWNDKSVLTNGYAATTSFLCGVAGVVVGMSQTYWVGPVAKAIGGEFGGDIAMWLCMGILGLVYPPLRYFELKKYGR